MVHKNWLCSFSIVVLLLACFVAADSCRAQTEVVSTAGSDVLSDVEWERVDDAVDRGLQWLAGIQQRDGSFPTSVQGQPGITALCTLAFVAHGHLPGQEPYGEQLTNAVQYILSCQKDNGLLALMAPRGRLFRGMAPQNIGGPLAYNHAIAALTLGEVYATGGDLNQEALDKAISRALDASLEMQQWKKRREADVGGWRYLYEHNLDEERFDSDLSVTGWYLMSLRSAKNAGFDVPQEPIDEAVGYVRRCFSKNYGTYQMMPTKHNRRSRGMAGAGILALAHAGQHRDPEVQLAGDWILKHGFEDYNKSIVFNKRGWNDDRYHYGVFNCCQGMYQLGGRYWESFYPRTVRTLLANQDRVGSWAVESNHDGSYGKAYTTALMLLALGAPNELLPIFQR